MVKPTKIELTQARLHRRMREIEKHFHVKAKTKCLCCGELFQGEIEDHLRKKHWNRCGMNCRDFDTDRCPYRPEVASVWNII